MTLRNIFSRSHLILPFCGIAVILFFQATRNPQPFDDAYITFRYARNISEGIGFVYNVGQPVLGTTTPLFTVILGFIGALLHSDAIPKAAFLIAIIADSISVWFIYRFARSAFLNEGIAFLVSIAFALNPFRLSVAIGGMEASLFNMFLLIAFDRLVVSRTFVSGSLFAALSLLTRPDAIIPLGLISAYLFLRDRSFALKYFALFIVLVSPWIVWATIKFGSPVPNSIIAKNSAYQFFPGFAAYFILTFLGTGTLAQYTITPGLLTASFTSLVIVIVGTIQIARQHPEYIPLVGYAPLFFTIMTIFNAPMFFSWYYYPILVGVIFSIVGFCWYLPISSPKIRVSLSAMIVMITILVPAYFMQIHPGWPLSRERESAYLDACQVLNKYTDPKNVILAPDIGVIGWCLPDNEIFDSIGLVSPKAIPYLIRRPLGQAISAELVLDAKPDFIVALEQYITPFLIPLSEFSAAYQKIWSETVSIAGTTQELYIYRLSNSSDP